MTRPSVVKVLRFAIGFAVPAALYYVLRAFDVSVFLALLASTLASALPGVVALLRDRRIDGISAYTTSMLVGSVLVSLVAGSPRFLLAREAVLTGVTGIWFLAGLRWGRRPLVYLFTKPLLEGRMHWPGSWDTMWDRLPRFRRMWRVSSVLWGLGLLADAVARVVMAYSLPVDVVPAMGTALYVVTSVVLIVVTNVYYVLAGIHNRHSRLYTESDDPTPTRTESMVT
jgi:hypothetical protein